MPESRRVRRIGAVHRLSVLLFTAILSLTLLVPSGRAQTPVRGGALRIGWIPNARTLDPHLSSQFSDRYILYMAFNTLVALDRSFNVVPELARSWQVSPDGKQITFELQRGVKFQDGTDFNADAVKWNIERILDPATKSTSRTLIEPAIAAVRAVDPHKVVFELKQPFPPLLAALAERPGFMVSPAAVKQLGADFARKPIGTGPFKVVEFVQDSHVTLERFADYWEKGKPYLDKVTVRVVPDATVRLTMVRTGEVDIATDVDAKDIPGLAGDPSVKVSEMKPPARWEALLWQVNKPPFDNKALRQAIALALDRKELQKVLLRGMGEPARGPVIPGVWWFDPGFTGFQYDLEAAKKKLAEAGYPNGFRAKFVVENTPQWIRQAELIQAQLRRINVSMDFEPVVPADAWANIFERKTNWSHTRWTTRADPHGLLFYLFHTKGYANTTGYSNPRVDELIERAATVYDPDKRKGLYHEAERMIVDDAPYVYLFYSPEFAVMKQKVQNWVWIPDLIPRFRDLWLEK